MKIIRIALALFLCLALTAELVPAAFAEEITGEDLSFTYVDPVYSDILTEEMIRENAAQALSQQAEDSDPLSPRRGRRELFLAREGVVYDSFDQAAAALHDLLKDFTASISISFKYPLAEGEDKTSAFFAARIRLYNAAFPYTGDPKEGDYLHYGIGGWDSKDGNSITGTGTETVFTIAYVPNYLTTPAWEETLDALVPQLLAQLNLQGKTPYQKISAIYDYICDNVSYGGSGNEQFTAYGALVNHLSVCQGYSLSFYRLCLESGVNARIVSRFIAEGSTRNHAWNIAELGEVYYELDATWDCGYAPQNYSYFLKGSDYWVTTPHNTIGDEFNPSDESYLGPGYVLPSWNYAAAITAHPQNCTTEAGSSASFEVAATGGELAYQWQRLGTEGGTWENIPGETGVKLTFTADESLDGTQYRCMVGNAAGNIYTVAAKLILDQDVCTVSFDTNGGSAVPAQKVAVGEKAEKPANPTKDGAWFIDWYTDNSFASAFSFDTAITQSITLYARWAEPDFILPAAMTEIGEEAFAGSAFRVVKLPEQAVTIGPRAFAECRNLGFIYIPGETSNIAWNAFDGTEGMTILGVSGSPAETYARIYGYTFLAVSEAADPQGE